MGKIRTACYVRTSTEREEQEGSFALQKEYFTNMIKNDPELEFVGCYGDFGKSGRSVEKRPEFQRMIKDCEEGKIEVIYTKSVSRFARNIADLAETVQHLRQLGVGVYFEREGLNTMERGTELLMNILGIIAQEESRSFGENVRIGVDIRNSSGHPTGNPPYGYRRINKNADWAIVEEEAKRVRIAFRMAAQIYNAEEICEVLNKAESAANTGIVWTPQRVYRVLANVAYKGDVITGKTFTINGKQRRNHGERPSYYLEGHHDPIVTRELFDRVRTIMAMKVPHYKTWKKRRTPAQVAFCEDDSWIAAQDKLEAGTESGRRALNDKYLEGGHQSGSRENWTEED